MTAPKTMYVRGNPNGAMGRWHDATPLEETAAIASDGPDQMFRYVLADPAALAGDELVLAMIGAVVDPHEKSYIDLHTKAFAVLQWFETARPDLIGPRIEALKAAIYGPRPYGEARPDATAAFARALQAERVKTLEEADAMIAAMMLRQDHGNGAADVILQDVRNKVRTLKEAQP